MKIFRFIPLVIATGFAPLLVAADTATEFLLSTDETAAALYIEPATNQAVVRAAGDLAADLERVTGRATKVLRDGGALKGDLIIAGVVGRSPLVDRLIAEGKLSAGELKGAWESYVIQVVDAPLPDVRRALVVAGSDRRGAIYGVYEISAAIGVSPWNWWADVAPLPQKRLTWPVGLRRFGPPSVKYRGIFLNDEDWGLLPWAAKTFEPEAGNIGPKTYGKLFELLLRLKANTVWPGMHPTTKPFNDFPENKRVADDYGIVMGSSHAEPMLRNNVGEWTAPKEHYNYVTNREGVLRYWDERVAANGRYENIYTLGMRGIHDSNMQGPKTDAERIRALEQIFTEQRAMIARHVVGDAGAGRARDVSEVPQMFCAYKEVLELYRQGLRVPEDVTLVWPDDNFGYVRNSATAEERKRPGGFGVYYHLSYLGRPLSYLWLSTTPPALVWEEMHKAYEHGADRIWIANVGDLKPAEISTEFFLQMAWDIDRWTPATLPQFLTEWAAREFGETHAQEIAEALGDYYRLNFQRRPEHLQWWLPRETPRPSTLTDQEVEARLAAFTKLRARADAIRTTIPPSRQDAFYQLVHYPITGSALANQRYFEGERGNAEAARQADAQLTEATRYFNEELAGGKWRGLMTLEPADEQWSSMRVARWQAPPAPRAPVASPAPGTFVAMEGGNFESSIARGGAAWTRVPGLGRTGAAITPLPTTMASVPLADAVKLAPRADYPFDCPATGEFALRVYFLPTHPVAGGALRLAVNIDDLPAQLVSLDVGDGGPAWAQGVLDATRSVSVPIAVSTPGRHTLHVYAIEPGIVVDKLAIEFVPQPPTYLGPQSPR